MKHQVTIPTNWEQIKVEDLSLRIHYGFTASSTQQDTGVKFLRITDIQDYKVKWEDVPFCDIDDYDIEKFLLEDGDIVFARTGATVGKSFLIQGKIPKAVFASYLIRIQLSKNIDPKYLFYFFQSADYWKQIGIKAMGIGQPSVNASSLSLVSLLLAPFNEQQRIVEKIEELFSELEHAEHILKKTQKQLSLYRYVLLKNAFEGELTKNWRTVNPALSAYKFLTKVKQERKENGKINRKVKKNALEYDFEFWKYDPISTWAIAKLNKLVTIAGRVGWKGLKKEEYTNSGPLLLSVHSLNFGKQVIFSNSNHISRERYDESPEIKLDENDILLCKDGAGIGKAGIVKGLPSPATINSSLLIIRGNEVFEPEYLYYFFIGPHIQALVNDRISGSAIPHLFQKDIKEFTLKVPPINEQKQIIQEIEYRFTIAENLDLTINSNLRKIEALRHGILQKAFSGKLVNQDKTDQSAAILLDRIKKEKLVFMDNKKNISRSKTTKRKPAEARMTIIEVLQNSKTPLTAKDVWLKSKHRDDIEEFYSELKELGVKVKEIKSAADSLLTLVK